MSFLIQASAPEPEAPPPEEKVLEEPQAESLPAPPVDEFELPKKKKKIRPVSCGRVCMYIVILMLSISL